MLWGQKGVDGGHPQTTNGRQRAHRLGHPSTALGGPGTEREAQRTQELTLRERNTLQDFKDCHLEEESDLFVTVVGQISVHYQEELSFSLCP